MADINIEFPKQDVENLMRAMERQSKALGIPMLEATQNAAKLVAYSAAAATKEAKAYRKYDVRSKANKKSGRAGVWRVRSDRPGKKDFTVMAGSVKELKADRRVIIARRGLAKMAWRVIGAQIPGSYAAPTGKTNANERTQSQAKRFGDVKIDRNIFQPTVTLTNSLKYAINAVEGGESALSNIVGKAARRMMTMTNAIVKQGMNAA